MAKAVLTLSNGTKVAIEGTAEDIAVLLDRFSGDAPTPSRKPRSRQQGRARESTKPKRAKDRIPRKGPQTLIAELAEENYFKSKRTIGDVQKKLEEKGHIYAITSLSTPLLRLTRAKTLRRLREKSGWVYVS